ncbi:MAG: hypothetical protein WDA21_03940 [Bacilli bacterium]
MIKMPPREKIPEALTVIADSRIEISNNLAEIFSSNRKKKYTVTWNDNVYTSNDNATYWQGYPGYTIIAVLLIKGKLNYDKNILSYFKDINWKEINTKFKNNYKEALNSVYQERNLSDMDINNIEKEIDNIYNQLSTLDIVIKKGKLFPPK